LRSIVDRHVKLPEIRDILLQHKIAAGGNLPEAFAFLDDTSDHFQLYLRAILYLQSGRYREAWAIRRKLLNSEIFPEEEDHLAKMLLHSLSGKYGEWPDHPSELISRLDVLLSPPFRRGRYELLNPELYALLSKAWQRVGNIDLARKFTRIATVLKH